MGERPSSICDSRKTIYETKMPAALVRAFNLTGSLADKGQTLFLSIQRV
jgi:hypothetical protein